MKQISVLLCLRYLQHRRIVLLSIAAVALSCALLIATDSLFTGFISAVENSVGQHLGDIILEAPANRTITDYDTLIQSLREADCIRSATAVLSSQGLLLSAPGKVRAVRVWGIELPRRLEVAPLQDSLLFQKDKPAAQVGFGVPGEADVLGGIVGIGVLSRPDETTDEYDMEAVKEMLGRRMALTTGSVVQAQDGQSESPGSPVRFSRKVVRFDLADVVMTGVNDFDESFVMLPIQPLSEALYPQRPPSANIIHIRLADGADEAQATAVVRGLWRRFAEGRFDWYGLAAIDSAKAMQARLIAEYKKQMGVLLLIFGLVSMGIILLVFCIFYLIVMTRRKDIGILKSCGLSSPSVAAMFVLFGTVVGIVGAAAGIGLGWLIIDNINAIEQAIASVFGIKLWKASTYLFARIPNTMHWGSVVWITASGIGAAAAGSLIPAIAAARIRPVEILQYE
ncbi:MAG: FtsX-like permease family protein [Planctomycetales bacterium]|nr:FtsX-like permease family protein [Planctomycetales bacterium]